MKKLIKRKMYHKRRKKEKSEQLKKASLPTVTGTTSATAPTYKHNLHKSKKYQKNFKYNNTDVRYQTISPITSYSQSLQLWWQTYCSAIEFHTQQQRTQQNENITMAEQQIALLEKYADEYETSSEGENDEDESPQATFDNQNASIDDEYLKFLEVTHKHQEELRLKKAQENV